MKKYILGFIVGVVFVTGINTAFAQSPFDDLGNIFTEIKSVLEDMSAKVGSIDEPIDVNLINHATTTPDVNITNNIQIEGDRAVEYAFRSPVDPCTFATMASNGWQVVETYSGETGGAEARNENCQPAAVRVLDWVLFERPVR